jgi:hypothetical protein
MEDVGLCYSQLIYFTAIWQIEWPFSTFCGHLAYFLTFWYAVPRKIWQPWSARLSPLQRNGKASFQSFIAI